MRRGGRLTLSGLLNALDGPTAAASGFLCLFVLKLFLLVLLVNHVLCVSVSFHVLFNMPHSGQT